MFLDDEQLFDFDDFTIRNDMECAYDSTDEWNLDGLNGFLAL